MPARISARSAADKLRQKGKYGTGVIDWQPLMGALVHSAYEGPLTLELMCQDNDVDRFLREAYQAGMRLEQMCREAKEN